MMQLYITNKSGSIQNVKRDGPPAQKKEENLVNRIIVLISLPSGWLMLEVFLLTIFVSHRKGVVYTYEEGGFMGALKKLNSKNMEVLS